MLPIVYYHAVFIIVSKSYIFGMNWVQRLKIRMKIPTNPLEISSEPLVRKLHAQAPEMLGAYGRNCSGYGGAQWLREALLFCRS